MEVVLFLQQYLWFRCWTVWVTETLGTYFSPAVGDWCAYHLGIVHSLMDVAEECRDWQGYRNCRDWIRGYEGRRK